MIVVSLDPGKSSGAAVIGYDPGGVWLVEAHQVGGGISGFRALVTDLQDRWSESNPIWISEKFSPRPNPGFGQSLESTLPLVCEGVLIDRDLLPEYSPGEKRWRQPVTQYLVGGRDKPDRKRRQHQFLKDSGFYRTNKDFPDSPSKDGADDFRSSCAHGLAYLAREIGHKPTFDLMTEWSNA